jgi:hypothetical protein
MELEELAGIARRVGIPRIRVHKQAIPYRFVLLSQSIG